MEWDSCDTLLKHGIWTVVFSIPDGYLVFTRPTVFCDGSWDYNSGRDTAHSTKDENCLTHLYLFSEQYITRTFTFNKQNSTLFTFQRRIFEVTYIDSLFVMHNLP